MKTLTPDLPTELRRDMPQRMSDLIKSTVDAHSHRDDDLREAYDMLMRIAPPDRNRGQRNSCQLIDSIVFQSFFPLFATVRAARVQRPYWLVEPIAPEDEESALRVEKGLTARASRDGFDAALYDSDWVALRDGAAPMYIGWTNKLRNVREIRYRAKGDPDWNNLITEAEKQPDVEYTEVPYLLPVQERSGFDFHVPDRANFYMMTPGANSVESAIGCGERMYFTANELVAGISQYGFERDDVEFLLTQGPTGYDRGGEYQESKRQVSGTDAKPDQEDGIGVWEMFRWFGNMPIWTMGGGIEVPDYLLNDEFLWIMCPHYDRMLRFSYSPFAVRPYTQFRMMREPQGQGGESVPTITSQYQEEGTAWLRMGIDSGNFRTLPVMKRLVSNRDRFGTQTLRPGGNYLCEKSLNEVEPMMFGHPGQIQETMNWLSDIRTQAKSAISGAGYGEIQQKVRKEAEIQAAVAGVSAKMGLIVDNIQGTGMERAALIMLSHLSQFGEDTFSVYQRGDKAVEITSADWQKVYSIRPRGSAEDANPAMVLQKRTQVLQMVRSSPIFQSKLQAGDMRPEYHALRQVLAAMGEEIKPYLGDEPPPPDLLQQIAQIMGQAYEQMTRLPGSAAQVTPMFMKSPAMLAAMSMLARGMKGGQGAPMGGPQQELPQMPMVAIGPGANGQAPQPAMNGVG